MSAHVTYEPEMPCSSEDELYMRTYAYEIAWQEYEIRAAERAYHNLVKKAAWSPADCAEADAIQAYIHECRETIAQLQAEAAASNS